MAEQGHRRRGIVAVVLGVVVALAGCADGGDPADEALPTSTSTTSTSTSTTAAPASGDDRTGAPRAELAQPGVGDPAGSFVLAYHSDGQVWAVTDSGATVRLTDGRPAGAPSLAPGGDTVVFPREADAVFADLIALDVSTGVERRIGAASAESFAEDGRLAVVPPVDDLVPREVVVHEAGRLAPKTTIMLPGSDGPNVYGVAWSGDGRSLLVTTGEVAGTDLWFADVASGRARAIETPASSRGAAWSIGRGTGRSFLAIRILDGAAAIGALTVTDGSADFDGVLMETHTPEAKLSLAELSASAPVGKVVAERLPEGHFAFQPGDEEAVVVGDGRALFLVTAAGTLDFLRSGAAWPSAP